MVTDDHQKTPRVGITCMNGAQLSFGVGYIGVHGGQMWCYQDEEDVKKPPHEVGALLLDPAYLEQESTHAEDAPLFVYRVTHQLS